jgi:hypothetical protein
MQFSLIVLLLAAAAVIAVPAPGELTERTPEALADIEDRNSGGTNQAPGW